MTFQDHALRKKRSCDRVLDVKVAALYGYWHGRISDNPTRSFAAYRKICAILRAVGVTLD